MDAERSDEESVDARLRAYVEALSDSEVLKNQLTHVYVPTHTIGLSALLGLIMLDNIPRISAGRTPQSL